MIFNLKLIKNGSQFVCECGHGTFIQREDFYCQKCHAVYMAWGLEVKN